jgi:hypothetical protein
MNEQDERKTKKYHDKRSKCHQNNHISFEQKETNDFTEKKIDPLEWFAEFLCTNYKFDTKVIIDIENKFHHNKMIIVKTSFPGFSIRIITGHGLNHNYIAMSYYNKKKNKTIGINIWYYVVYEVKEKYTTNNVMTENDKKFNAIFSTNDFVNYKVANEIIEHIQYNLEPYNFCKFIHTLGYQMIFWNQLLHNQSCHKGEQNDQEICDQYAVCFSKYNEILKKCESNLVFCSDYKFSINAFEKMNSTFFENIPVAKEIRRIVIRYLFG